MKTMDLMLEILSICAPDDEILFCQDDGSGYTCEMSDTPTITRNPDRDLGYWEKEYGKKFNVIFGGC